MTRSVMDDLGEELTGIIAPVSLCMALVVVLVKALNPDGQADATTVAIATIAYHEQVAACVGVADSCSAVAQALG
jgi:presenilin 1